MNSKSPQLNQSEPPGVVAKNATPPYPPEDAAPSGSIDIALVGDAYGARPDEAVDDFQQPVDAFQVQTKGASRKASAPTASSQNKSPLLPSMHISPPITLVPKYTYEAYILQPHTSILFDSVNCSYKIERLHLDETALRAHTDKLGPDYDIISVMGALLPEQIRLIQEGIHLPCDRLVSVQFGVPMGMATPMGTFHIKPVIFIIRTKASRSAAPTPPNTSHHQAVPNEPSCTVPDHVKGPFYVQMGDYGLSLVVHPLEGSYPWRNHESLIMQLAATAGENGLFGGALSANCSLSRAHSNIAALSGAKSDETGVRFGGSTTKEGLFIPASSAGGRDSGSPQSSEASGELFRDTAPMAGSLPADSTSIDQQPQRPSALSLFRQSTNNSRPLAGFAFNNIKTAGNSSLFGQVSVPSQNLFGTASTPPSNINSSVHLMDQRPVTSQSLFSSPASEPSSNSLFGRATNNSTSLTQNATLDIWGPAAPAAPNLDANPTDMLHRGVTESPRNLASSRFFGEASSTTLTSPTSSSSTAVPVSTVCQQQNLDEASASSSFFSSSSPNPFVNAMDAPPTAQESSPATQSGNSITEVAPESADNDYNSTEVASVPSTQASCDAPPNNIPLTTAVSLNAPFSIPSPFQFTSTTTPIQSFPPPTILVTTDSSGCAGDSRATQKKIEAELKQNLKKKTCWLCSTNITDIQGAMSPKNIAEQHVALPLAAKPIVPILGTSSPAPNPYIPVLSTWADTSTLPPHLFSNQVHSPNPRPRRRGFRGGKYHLLQVRRGYA
ncbi:hypothetical protein T440DRAFT_481991 [Plenodomus tracheiphilus IPT5]|uniref:Uncharacterized protein n=1 Tax=Plenodomus tracheiphilus IPT5 TaxID=1408161 RepID=A0A6A7AXS3_9PLEO|nr:hypothetical protein T440DRAFT_481991 [Plenodomus tracheiphilus IPT5]